MSEEDQIGEWAESKGLDPILTKLIWRFRKTLAEQIAREIVGVQPMPHDVFAKLYQQAHNEEELRGAGYKPVDDQTKLMWIGKEE